MFFFLPLLITPFSFSVAFRWLTLVIGCLCSKHRPSHLFLFHHFLSNASHSFPPQAPEADIKHEAASPDNHSPSSSPSKLFASFKITILSFHCNITAHLNKCCCLGASSSGSQHLSTDPGRWGHRPLILGPSLTIKLVTEFRMINQIIIIYLYRVNQTIAFKMT